MEKKENAVTATLQPEKQEKKKGFSKSRAVSKIAACLLGVLVLLLVCTLLFQKSGGTTFGSFRLLTVLSGSMEPAISVGSVVLTGPVEPENIVSGDIITYHPLEDSEVLVTHRVVRIVDTKDAFITKGDANNREDSDSVRFDQVVGKAIVVVPLFGLLLSFLRTPFGIFFVIVAFLLLIVLEELLKKNAKQ